MSMRIVSLWVPDFPLAARVRQEPEISQKPVAILETEGAASRIVAVSHEAHRQGLRPGFSLSHARTLLPDVVAKARARSAEASAQEALLEAVLDLSPIVENAGLGCVFIDIRGICDESGLLYKAIEKSAAIGLPARAAVAGTRIAARLAAQRAQDQPEIIPVGHDAAYLAPLPLLGLGPSPALLERLSRWGVRTAGQLAALPAGDLARRLGQEGLALHRAARGEDEKPLLAWRPPEILSERVDLEWTLCEVEPFLVIAKPMIERLCCRLSSSGLACRRLDLVLSLDPKGEEARTLTLAAPTVEVKTLMELVSLDLTARPPQAPVVGIAIQAHPDRARQIQFSLFGPSVHSPDRLSSVMARLAILLGADRIGAPKAVDGVRPERFALSEYAPPPPPKVIPPLTPRPLAVAVRVLRPMISLKVEVGGIPPQPQVIEADPEKSPLTSGRVRVASGPWRLEEGWWSEMPVTRSYWDVELSHGNVFRIFCDPKGNWFADGIYD